MIGPGKLEYLESSDDESAPPTQHRLEVVKEYD